MQDTRCVPNGNSMAQDVTTAGHPYGSARQLTSEDAGTAQHRRPSKPTPSPTTKMFAQPIHQHRDQVSVPLKAFQRSASLNAMRRVHELLGSLEFDADSISHEGTRMPTCRPAATARPTPTHQMKPASFTTPLVRYTCVAGEGVRPASAAALPIHPCRARDGGFQPPGVRDAHAERWPSSIPVGPKGNVTSKTSEPIPVAAPAEARAHVWGRYQCALAAHEASVPRQVIHHEQVTGSMQNVNMKYLNKLTTSFSSFHLRSKVSTLALLVV